jgi:hypothetical protein
MPLGPWLLAEKIGYSRVATLEAKGPLFFYTLLRTAKLNGIEPEAYLREVLNRIGEHPINAIDALLPWNIFRPATPSVAA